MAKKFGNKKTEQLLKDVAKTSAQKAKVVEILNISVDDLIDNPDNGEDISHTDDLELSMQENGFTDPIEVTDFDMEEGKYMILSGHRRRAAAVKVGLTVLPCIIRHFDNKSDVMNYTLMANSQRDSAKDPLLYSKRYKMHEAYLEESGFAGSIRHEVARRLGISVQQADRYNMMNKIIEQVWDLIYAGSVSMSAVQPLATYESDEQMVIYKMMMSAYTDNLDLTRPNVKMIVDKYKEGFRSWEEVVRSKQTTSEPSTDKDIPLSGSMDYSGSTLDGSEKEDKPSDRGDEVRREHDPIADEADKDDKAREIWEEQQNKKARDKSESKDQEISRGKDILKCLERIDTLMSNTYKFEDTESGNEILTKMGLITNVLITEMFSVADEYDMLSDFDKVIREIKSTIETVEPK